MEHCLVVWVADFQIILPQNPQFIFLSSDCRDNRVFYVPFVEIIIDIPTFHSTTCCPISVLSSLAISSNSAKSPTPFENLPLLD